MRNTINKDLALIMLVIIALLGSGTFHDAFGSNEMEQDSAKDGNMDYLLKFDEYMTDWYGQYYDSEKSEKVFTASGDMSTDISDRYRSNRYGLYSDEDESSAKSSLRFGHSQQGFSRSLFSKPFDSYGSAELYGNNRNVSFQPRDNYYAYSDVIGQGSRSSLYFSRVFQGVAGGSEKGNSETNKQHDHGELADKATDPTSNLIQFRMQNSFIPESFDSSGYSNLFEIQPIIPWKAPWGQLMITRLTIPFPTPTANLDGPIGRTSGLSDIDLLHAFIFKRDWGNIALGANMVFPTATDERLGSGKWQAGPAAAIVYKKIPKWQLGGLVINNWSFDTNRHGKENVNEMSIQWIANYHYKPGWYVGWGDLPMTFNWKNGKQNIPLSAKWGHVTKIGKQPVDMFIQPFFTPSHDGATGEWGIKFNLALLLPE